MQQVYYWSPYIGNVATIKAVLNSLYSLKKYSKNKLTPSLIDSCGEWENFKDELLEKKISIKKLDNKFRINTSISGFYRSRFAFLKIFFSCFFLLKKLLKNDKPHFLIVHLISSLPLFLYILFNFETKLIIRVSGKVKMNFFRKLLWKVAAKKIHLIFCPTNETKYEFQSMKLINNNKIIYLPDPVLSIRNISKLKNENIENYFLYKNYFLSVGRFTKQKNHFLLMKVFMRISSKIENIKLVLIGNGELKKDYIDFIKKNSLEEKILILDYKRNIFNYLKNSRAFISTSLWEDPGFVMIEAAAVDTFVISSDCSSGPKEFISHDGGLLFKNNNDKSLEDKIYQFLNLSKNKVFDFKKNLKKRSLKFTHFQHYKNLSYYLLN